MSVMKKIENEVPFKSGCDYEDASELQLGLEEPLELHSAASSAATNSKQCSTSCNLSRRQKESRAALTGIIGHVVS
jgi:hypothetical protein